MSDAQFLRLVSVNEEDPLPPRTGPEPATWDPLLCTLQFSAPIFYADQAEGEMAIDIMRMGDGDSRVAAKYSTQDVSAKAGETYRAMSGEVVFERGETRQTIVVPLIQSGIWSATVEFNVVLSEPSFCNLDPYLYECRVKVIDDNVFPSNKFGQELKSRAEVRDDHLFYVFWEYIKWNLRSAKLLLSSLAVVLLDQLKNANKILLLYCDMYFVNIVCDPKAPEESLLLPSHQQTAYLIAAAHIVPLLVLYVGSLLKTRLDVKGHTFMHLQKNVYRKSMNLSQRASSGEIDALMHIDCQILANGFAAALEVIEVSVNVGMHFYFILVSNPMCAPFALSVPAVIVAWVFLRRLCFATPDTKDETERMKDYVNETNRKSELVRTFYLRPQMNAGFVRLAEDLHAEGNRIALQERTTQAGLNAVAPIFIGIYMAARVKQILAREIQIGTVLATIAVMENIANLTLTAYSAFIVIVDSFPSLEELIEFLNSETELPALKEANRVKRVKSGLYAGSAALVCQDAAFSYDSGVELLSDLNITAAQGKIFEVRGEHRSCKHTFMRLLGQTMRATKGLIFTMTHMRTLFVPCEVQFFDKSLVHNLTVGCPHFGRPDVPRLVSILRDLRLDKVLKVIDEELASSAKLSGKDTWSETLTRTDLQMLSLARALMMNPAVLVVHNLFAGLSDSRVKDVEQAIVAHVANRGLHLPIEDFAHRHPRTVFYSAQGSRPYSCADVVWVMTPTGALNSRGDPIWTVREDLGECA